MQAFAPGGAPLLKRPCRISVMEDGLARLCGGNLNRSKLPRRKAPPQGEGKIDHSGEGQIERSGQLSCFEYETHRRF